MNKIFCLILLTLTAVSVEAQMSSLSNFLNENYQEGERAFLEKIYKNIDYPKSARDARRVGKLKVIIKITPRGQLKEIEFLNKLGYGLEEEVIRMINLVGNDWKKTDSDSLRTIELVFAFQLGGIPIIKGDINVTAEGVLCKSNKFYLSRFKKFMKKKKYEKAKKVTEELLRRDPDSEKYRELDKIVQENLKAVKSN